MLIEHKVRPDRLVREQVLRYAMQLWEREGCPDPLPTIVAIVLYHGAAAWKHSRDFSDLFGSVAPANPECVRGLRP